MRPHSSTTAGTVCTPPRISRITSASAGYTSTPAEPYALPGEKNGLFGFQPSVASDAANAAGHPRQKAPIAHEVNQTNCRRLRSCVFIVPSLVEVHRKKMRPPLRLQRAMKSRPTWARLRQGSDTHGETLRRLTPDVYLRFGGIRRLPARPLLVQIQIIQFLGFNLHAGIVTLDGKVAGILIRHHRRSSPAGH